MNKEAVLLWEPITLENTYEESTPTEYLVHGVIEIPSFNIVYGAPATFKSFLLADLAVCVASGLDWLQPLSKGECTPFKVTQGPVIWIDFDNGKRRTKNRFAAVGKAYGRPENVGLSIYSMPFPTLDCGNIDHINQLMTIIQDSGVKLVIIDNLSTISGGADENSKDMAVICQNLRWISENAQCAIIVIHHPRKGSTESARLGDSLRGHSSIEASLDLALLVKQSGNAPDIVVIPTKVRGDSINPFNASFFAVNDDAGELQSARFYRGGGAQKESQIRTAIWNALEKQEMNQGDLKKAVKGILDGIGDNRIEAEIKKMAEEGYLISYVGVKNAHLNKRNPEKSWPPK